MRPFQSRPRPGAAIPIPPPGPQGDVFTNPIAPAATFLAGAFFFSSQTNEISEMCQYFVFCMNIWAKNCQKNVQIEGRDPPPGEIRAGILRITAPRMCKTVGWRPDW